MPASHVQHAIAAADDPFTALPLDDTLPTRTPESPLLEADGHNGALVTVPLDMAEGEEQAEGASRAINDVVPLIHPESARGDRTNGYRVSAEAREELRLRIIAILERRWRICNAVDRRRVEIGLGIREGPAERRFLKIRRAAFRRTRRTGSENDGNEQESRSEHQRYYRCGAREPCRTGRLCPRSISPGCATRMVLIVDDWRCTGHLDRPRVRRRPPLRMLGAALVILTGGAPTIRVDGDAWRPNGVHESVPDNIVDL